MGLVSFGLVVVGIASAAVVIGWLGPESWYGPVGVMAIASALVWWFAARADRTRERDLSRIATELERLGARDEGPSNPDPYGRVLARIADIERRSADRDARTKSDAGALREVLDAVSVPVISSDGLSRVASANAAACRLLERNRDRIIGRPLEDLFVQAELASLVNRARSGATASGRVRFVAERSTRFFDVTASPWGEGGAVLTLRDVTELATAVHLKTDFAANASHELRTPIAAIKGAVETMAAAEDDPQMTARLRTMIAQHVARLGEMVDDLLDLSKLEAQVGHPARAPVAGSSIARRMDELFTPACAERGLTLEFDLDPALERMEIDPQLLELMLRNLIDNAIKFARDATPVRIVGRAAQVEPNDDAVLPWAADETLAGARFRVIDQGVGIPLTHQHRIFERFYQVDPSRDGRSDRRGTGLGLAIVKHAARRLGGRVAVESVWQEGTTMEFEIPACVRVGGPHEDERTGGQTAGQTDRSSRETGRQSESESGSEPGRAPASNAGGAGISS